jgi:hypothetical protein
MHQSSPRGRVVAFLAVLALLALLGAAALLTSCAPRQGRYIVPEFRDFRVGK